MQRDMTKKNCIRLTALPVLCADVFDGTDEIRPGGEALNLAAHAAQFPEVEVMLLGIIGEDAYGSSILESVKHLPVDTTHVRIDRMRETAYNRIYLTAEGDRYHKEDSWHGEILQNIVLSEEEIEILKASDVVFLNFWSSCLEQVIELKKAFGFKLAVDFDVYRDFDDMERYAPYVDFFMISGAEELLPYFKRFSEKYEGLFNMSLAEKGSVTYKGAAEYRVEAVPVDKVVDTTGCGDSYHAGFICSYMIDGDIEKAMRKGSEIASKTLSHYGGF